MTGKSSRRRTLARQRVQRYYKRDDAGLGGVCVYCGIRANTEDHVPPLSAAIEMEIEYLRGLEPRLFPACQNCNSILGASLELMLVDRRDIIAHHLQTKRRRMLARGKEIYEKKLPVFSDLRDRSCLTAYERWQFASITTNEATPNPEPEEEYVRDRFYPKKSPEAKSGVAQATRSGVLPNKKHISIQELKNVDIESISESDLSKVVLGFVNLAEKEIEFVIDCLKNHEIIDGRDRCIDKFKHFLNKEGSYILKSGDGVDFFLAVLFSLNCTRDRQREILSSLRQKFRK